MNLEKLEIDFDYDKHKNLFAEWTHKYKNLDFSVEGKITDYGLDEDIKFKGNVVGQIKPWPHYCGGVIVYGIQNQSFSIETYKISLEVISEFIFTMKISQIFMIHSLREYSPTKNNIMKEYFINNSFKISDEFVNQKTSNECLLLMKNNPKHV